MNQPLKQECFGELVAKVKDHLPNYMTNIKPVESISKVNGLSRLNHSLPQSLLNTNKNSGKGLKQTLKDLVDYSRNSNRGSNILNLATTGLTLASGIGARFSIDLGINKLIEDEVNRNFFKPEIIFKTPEKELDLIGINPTSPDETTLYGYYFENPNSELAVIYLHGYTGSIFECHRQCTKIKEELNVNALVVDYTGFGINMGTPTINRAVRDTERMYDYLINEKGFKEKNIIIYGVSLGGAIAAETYVTKLKSQKKELGALWLLNTFSSIRDITRWRYPQMPYHILPNDKLNSKRLAKYIDIPLHIAHGEMDNETPNIQSFKIYENAKSLKPEQKEIYIIDGIGHEDLQSSNPSINGYIKSLRSFILKHFPEHKV